MAAEINFTYSNFRFAVGHVALIIQREYLTIHCILLSMMGTTQIVSTKLIKDL